MSPATAQGNQRGTASTELAVVAPLMLLVIFATVQAALWYNARNAAESAAAACAEATRGYAASGSDGQAAAMSIASQSGALHHITVNVTSTSRQVTCRVSGHGGQLIKIGTDPITTEVTMPKDRISQP